MIIAFTKTIYIYIYIYASERNHYNISVKGMIYGSKLRILWSVPIFEKTWDLSGPLVKTVINRPNVNYFLKIFFPSPPSNLVVYFLIWNWSKLIFYSTYTNSVSCPKGSIYSSLIHAKIPNVRLLKLSMNHFRKNTHFHNQKAAREAFLSSEPKSYFLWVQPKMYIGNFK